MKKILFFLPVFMLFLFSCKKENKTIKPTAKIFSEKTKTDSTTIKHFFNTALTEKKSHQWLRDLTKNVGSRLSGSAGAEKAVIWGEKLMKQISLDSVWLQPVMVPHWVRGAKEEAYYTLNGQKINVAICALGGSIATPENGITAPIIEVKSIEDAKKLGNKARGKIVFFNGAFNNTLINTFSAYGGCVGQRFLGAATVGKFGAKGVIVRSMTNKIDNYPHTGSMSYGDIPKEQHIPAAAISSLAAENLSKHLKENPTLKLYFKQHCKNLPDAPSFNVIGQLKGTQNPEKIIVVGGHLDSWDLGEGAHDDGTGIVQSLEVAYLFKQNKIQPKNTIRIVFFMNEENGTRGAKEYARLAKLNNENHIAGLESDAGGHTPRGFSIDANPKNTALIQSWNNLLKPYGLHDLFKGGSGADIAPLKKDHPITLVGYRPDSQRYFDYHHAATDVFENVNERELALGSAAMASLVYLMDSYLYTSDKIKP